MVGGRFESVWVAELLMEKLEAAWQGVEMRAASGREKGAVM